MRDTILFIEWASFGNVAMRKAFEKIGYSIEMYGLEHKKIDTKKRQNIYYFVFKLLLFSR